MTENWSQLLQGSSHISMPTLASVLPPIGFSHKNRHLTILEDLFHNLSNCKVNDWSSLPLVSALQLWGTRLCFWDTTNAFSFHTWLSICEFIFLSSPLLFISFSSFRCCYYTFFSKKWQKNYYVYSHLTSCFLYRVDFLSDPIHQQGWAGSWDFW